MRQLRRAVWREREGCAEQHARCRRTGQLSAEQVREKSGQPGREDQGDVVGGDRIDAEQVQRRCEERNADQVFGEREAPGHRVEDRRVPPAFGERKRLGAPPQDPCIEEGIARVVRDSPRQPGRERPRPGEGEQEEE